MDYKSFIDAHKFQAVKNCYLLTTDKKVVENLGCVSIAMMTNLGLQDIEVRSVPATLAYDFYLSNKKLDIGMLEL